MFCQENHLLKKLRFEKQLFDEIVRFKIEKLKQYDRDILSVLAYFDLFSYPLTLEEITLFLTEEPDEDKLEVALHGLVLNRYIFKIDHFYALRDDDSLAELRVTGNQRAQKLLKVGRKKAHWLYGFPYVRGIGISGSLSKNYASTKGDIDYFIITAPNRLWIARTCMHLFKKFTYFTGRQHWYCMNYYIDGDALAINEMNVFTAMETVTLLPVCGDDAFVQFFDVNDWTGLYFPHYRFGQRKANKDDNIGFPNCRNWELVSRRNKIQTLLANGVERLFNHAIGDWLDRYLMRLTTRRWEKKEKNQLRNMNGNRMGIRTGRHYCKPAPEFLQTEILLRYRKKLEELEERYAFDLNPFF